MTGVDAAFLVLTVAAFVAFAATVAWVTHKTHS